MRPTDRNDSDAPPALGGAGPIAAGRFDPLAPSDAFVASAGSTLVNLILMLGLAMMPTTLYRDPESIVIVSDPPAADVEPLDVIEDVAVEDVTTPEIGAASLGGDSMAMASAEVFAEIPDVSLPLDMTLSEISTVAVDQRFVEPVAPLQLLETNPGRIGDGTRGAAGAVDRIVAEILESLEQQPTLVVWLFDQSGSLHRQRQLIRDRFDSIYEDLGVAVASLSTRRRDVDEAPLLTSIMGFGREVQLYTPRPTDDLDTIREIVGGGIETDPSGVENVFEAVVLAAERFRPYRRGGSRIGPARNVLFVVVTDERGDDVLLMERAVKMCADSSIPVHVIGVPAPFGREHTFVKYVDPDPQYDQSPVWAQVDSGPETLRVEHVQLGLAESLRDEPPIDSGFGPFGLTRLSLATGGIFFPQHPDHRLGRELNRGEVTPFAQDLRVFFDPTVMRRYQPEYISPVEYQKRLLASPLRSSLVRAAEIAGATGLEAPKTRFTNFGDQADLVRDVQVAQRAAAVLDPQLAALYRTLQPGLAARDSEVSPRWRAGFDLALGRVTAHYVRTSGYNTMLAQLVTGKRFTDAKNNTWVLKPADGLEANSRMDRQSEEARRLLQGVIDEHAGTPWAYLAQKELDTPVGWRWTETHTPPPKPREMTPGPANNNPPMRPRDDEAMRLERKPKRPVIKL